MQESRMKKQKNRYTSAGDFLRHLVGNKETRGGRESTLWSCACIVKYVGIVRKG